MGIEDDGEFCMLNRSPSAHPLLPINKIPSIRAMQISGIICAFQVATDRSKGRFLVLGTRRQSDFSSIQSISQLFMII